MLFLGSPRIALYSLHNLGLLIALPTEGGPTAKGLMHKAVFEDLLKRKAFIEDLLRFSIENAAEQPTWDHVVSRLTDLELLCGWSGRDFLNGLLDYAESFDFKYGGPGNR